MKDEKILASARSRFDSYLQSSGKRHTPERAAVLERVFASHDHFYIETLHASLAEHGYRLSLATVYNTLQLLMDAGLVRRHQFSNQPPQYERITSATTASHIHLVCSQCGRVTEARDSNIAAAVNAHRYTTSFEPQYFSLYVYGICSRCRRKGKRNS